MLLKDAKIIIGNSATGGEKRAAAILQNYTKLVCGKKLPILTDDTPATDYEIVIGRTSREASDGLHFIRERSGVYEYIVKSIGKRLYITGFGTPAVKPEKYVKVTPYYDKGDIGTLYGVYSFIERYFGFDFQIQEYDDYTENENLEFPLDFEFEYTRAKLRDAKIEVYDNATSMYMLPITTFLEWNIMSYVFRTKEGKLVVIDGGHAEETEVLMKVLRQLTPDEKPVISAWLMTHMHIDHYGMLRNMVREAEAGKEPPVKIENVYWNFLPEEFYSTLSKEPSAEFASARNDLMRAESALGCKMNIVNENDEFNIDELNFRVLRVASMKDAQNMNMNDSSTVFKLTVDQGQTVLFLGDSEWVSNNDLMERQKDNLKSDIVQVGHHGVYSISEECYRVIDPKVCLWQVGIRYYFSDGGEGINSFNLSMLRTRRRFMDMGIKRDNIYFDVFGIRSFKFPIEIK